MSKQKTEVVVPPGSLWPKTPWGADMNIEVFGATGEFSTGKTLLGLSIAPGLHPAGHPFAGKPRTLYLDLEKSGATYGGTGCLRMDVPAEMAKLYGANYSAKQVAEWFIALPGKLAAGQFDVILFDPINDIDSGIVDLVKANPTAHGYTANQFSASVGLLMAAVKAYMKKVLMAYSNVCKCFFFTTHLRDEFKGGKPSGKREPRGKETLAELASLYLWLERLPDDKGAVPDKPSAIVLKQRLADTRMNEAGELEVVNLMPPRIPVATVQELRRYIANPPDYAKLTAAERIVEKTATEEEMLRLKLATAEMNALAETARGANLDRQQQLLAVRQAAQNAAPQQPDRSAQVQADAAAKREADALAARIAADEAESKRLMAANNPSTTGAASTTPTATGTPPNRIDRFKTAVVQSQITPEKLKQALSALNRERFSQLTVDEQDSLLSWLEAIAQCQQLVVALSLGEEKVKQLTARAAVEKISDLGGELAKALQKTLVTAWESRNPGKTWDGIPF